MSEGGKCMNQLSYKDANGELVTKQQMAECINTGYRQFAKLLKKLVRFAE